MTIKSQFDGEEREFGIDRKHISIFEAAMGRSAYAVLKEITAGQWRFDDLAAVLSFALHGPTPELKLAHRLATQSAKYGASFGGIFAYSPHPAVVKALQAEGHGNFAELAVEILTDAIFGASANGTA